jgi:hypothetical protein
MFFQGIAITVEIEISRLVYHGIGFLDSVYGFTPRAYNNRSRAVVTRAIVFELFIRYLRPVGFALIDRRTKG